MKRHFYPFMCGSDCRTTQGNFTFVQAAQYCKHQFIHLQLRFARDIYGTWAPSSGEISGAYHLNLVCCGRNLTNSCNGMGMWGLRSW